MTLSTQDRPRAPPARPPGLLAVPMILLTAGALVAQDRASTQEYRPSQEAAALFEGNTIPSREMDLAFPNLGQILEVNVKEGDQVEAGQVLMVQDIRADIARLQALQLEANVGDRVDLARTQADLARVELKAAEEAGPALSPLEAERAQLEVKAADTRILEEQRLGQVATHRAEEQQYIVEQKTLRSPETGVVQQIEATVGEVFGPQTPAMRVVKIDPLYVEIPTVPAREVMALKLGDTIQVRYEGEDQWRDATIVFINPVGNPSGTTSRLPFRAELSNPEGRPAGLRVEVRLPGQDGA